MEHTFTGGFHEEIIYYLANEIADPAVYDASDLEKKLTELKKDLFQLRLQHATNQLENPVRINEVKRDIARVKTIIREQQLAGQ